jgi:hypothetical protein
MGYCGIEGNASGQQRRRHWRHGALVLLSAGRSIGLFRGRHTCRSSNLAAMVCSIGGSPSVEVEGTVYFEDCRCDAMMSVRLRLFLGMLGNFFALRESWFSAAGALQWHTYLPSALQIHLSSTLGYRQYRLKQCTYTVRFIEGLSIVILVLSLSRISQTSHAVMLCYCQ